jgi:hypothetical protein
LSLGTEAFGDPHAVTVLQFDRRPICDLPGEVNEFLRYATAVGWTVGE